jgi:cellulose synthase/poly-beta-1,6-N-acetylglucosamine synthase-like glycosyltransferase
VGADPGGRTCLPTVSVVVAAFTMDRWDDLSEALASVSAQTARVLETIVVIDHHPVLLARARRELPCVTVVPNVGSQGAAGARNSGVAQSAGEVVAFIDDDAIAAPTWLEKLLGHFADPGVVGVGGRLYPLWAGTRPRWFPQEFDWAIGASYRGMPQVAMPVRNVWSGNMAIRRRVFDEIAGFRDGFGKRGEHRRPEDTDLCMRAAAADRGSWIYEPAALAGHRVPPQRATLGYFLRRCLDEGAGKAALAALNGASDSTLTERHYTRQVLPRGVARGLRDTARGDASGWLRSIAIAAGFSCATAGFLASRASGIIHGQAGG